MSYLNVFKTEFENTIVPFDASTFELFKMQSFMQNKVGVQNALFGCVLGCNKKTIVFFVISTIKIVKNDFLANKVNFGIRSIFSYSPGSGFSEGPGPYLDPPYKVYRAAHR